MKYFAPLYMHAPKLHHACVIAHACMCVQCIHMCVWCRMGISVCVCGWMCIIIENEKIVHEWRHVYMVCHLITLCEYMYVCVFVRVCTYCH